jgi:hypothetical protein
MKWGDPSRYAQLKAGDKIARYFSKRAGQQITRVHALSCFLRIANVAGVGWNLYSAYESGDEVRMTAARWTTGMSIGYLTAEYTTRQFAKHGIISLATEKTIATKILGPIGWAILVGQLGQLEIEYLSQKNIIAIKRRGTEKIMFMLKSHRDRMLDEMFDIELKRIGTSGLIPNSLFED